MASPLDQYITTVKNVVTAPFTIGQAVGHSIIDPILGPRRTIDTTGYRPGGPIIDPIKDFSQRGGGGDPTIPPPPPVNIYFPPGPSIPSMPDLSNVNLPRPAGLDTNLIIIIALVAAGIIAVLVISR